MRYILHRGKQRAFLPSPTNHPDGTSLPEAGAVYHVRGVVLRPGQDGRFQSVRQFASARCASVRELGGLADDNERCPVFGVGSFGMLSDYRQSLALLPWHAIAHRARMLPQRNFRVAVAFPC